jgi:hypothetical protein
VSLPENQCHPSSSPTPVPPYSSYKE